jgi:imidazoleglycerol-phosphate dehydratase
MRKTKIDRKTHETEIKADVNLDGTGKANINTGIGFFNHLLTLFVFHGDFDVELQSSGDLEVDDHHTVEDVGIVLGRALRQLCDNKKGLKRYGFFILPMDEVLARVVLDISGRAYLHYNTQFKYEKIGHLTSETLQEFFRALVRESGITLHLDILTPGNDHHQAEALFKCFGKALRMAVQRDENEGIPSTKGKMD